MEMIALSNQRVSPRCIHFGVCGGCRWQHISYEEQLKLKQTRVQNCFKDLVTKEVDFRKILPSIKQWQYRNKMEFSFSSDAQKSQFLGLMKDASRGRVLQLTECHLPNSWFVEAIEVVREWWKASGLDAYHAPSNKGSLNNFDPA